jgi:hypothetical protein
MHTISSHLVGSVAATNDFELHLRLEAAISAAGSFMYVEVLCLEIGRTGDWLLAGEDQRAKSQILSVHCLRNL